MTKEALIGKNLKTKTGDVLEIVDVEESSDFKAITLKTKNKKIFNLYLGYKNGFIRFEDENINKEIDEYIKNENMEIEKKRKIIEENDRLVKEKERLEKEKIDNAINSFRGDYDFLSNFYNVKVIYDGYTYLNNEAAFQAQKDLSRRIEFTDLNPVSAKRLGKKVKLREDWEEVKLGIMEEIVRCKFDQNPDLKEKLMETGDRLLIEGNTWNDTFWGECNGKGRNHLGKILMKIREEYKS